MSTNLILDLGTPVEDEGLAAESSARVLISATTCSAVHAIAFRIHRSSERSELPFIHVNVTELPSGGTPLDTAFARLFEAAGGGTVLLNGVDRMPSDAQNRLIACLDELELVSASTDASRVLSGTTVWLFNLVRAGTFSESLFYRLNVLHLHTNGAGPVLGQTVHVA